MGDESLFYDRKARASTVLAYLGGPTPSKPDDRPSGSTSRGRIPRVVWTWRHTAWLARKSARVALLPRPIEGRRALCRIPLHELPDPTSQRTRCFWLRTGPRSQFRSLFGTRSRCTGTCPRSVPENSPSGCAWDRRRITLTSSRPADDQRATISVLVAQFVVTSSRHSSILDWNHKRRLAIAVSAA